MGLTRPELWEKIAAWPLPDLALATGFLGRTPTLVPFERRLAADLVLLDATAAQIVLAYRQWLYLCALEGRRLQASDIIRVVEALHREAEADWRALTLGMGLEDAGAARAKGNDADYAATLALLHREAPGGVIDGRAWPALWRCRLGRWPLGCALLAGLGMAGLGFAAQAGMPGNWLTAGMIVLGGLGAVIAFVLLEMVPFTTDDRAA